MNPSAWPEAFRQVIVRFPRKRFSPPVGKTYVRQNIASCVFCSTHPLLPQKITATRPRTGRFHLLMTASMNEQQQHPKRRKGGRTPKSAPAFHRETVNLDAAQHARFLTLYEQSGLSSKSKFIAARIFGDSFRVIRTDRGTMEYVARLSRNCMCILPRKRRWHCSINWRS